MARDTDGSPAGRGGPARGGVHLRLVQGGLGHRPPPRRVAGLGVASMSGSILPPMPEIGHTESYYARLAKLADEKNLLHAREAAKVGQYITLALDKELDWDSKRRYFRHALRRHCTPPPVSHDLVAGFYDRLATLVRE